MILALRLALLALCLLAAPATAKPLTYALDPAGSEVGFRISMGASPLKGTMPVKSAKLLLDFDRAAQSRVEVILSPDAAQMGLPFATSAMKSPEVLDTARHPEIRFVSTAVRAKGNGAEVEGKITIRGVTRPILLQARLSRRKGTPEGYRQDLTIRLTGKVKRSDFGATGYPDLVGDEVELAITAHIRLSP